MTIVVALATYQRPALLAELIPALLTQTQKRAHTHVVIVDNDPDQSARVVVEPYLPPHQGSSTPAHGAVVYVHEPRPGIAAARNKALDTARSLDAKAVVFIDDDEMPLDGWLTSLVTAWEEWACAAVSGPVLSIFAEPVDAWTSKAEVFARKRSATGTVRAGAATNNVLFDLAVLDREQLRFDDDFGLTGGSDTLLTRDLTARGHEIRWCDEAVVSEVVPPERSNRTWVLARAKRTGNVWSRVHIALAPPHQRAQVTRDMVKLGIAHYGRGTARSLRGRITRDLTSRVLGQTDRATAAGLIKGARGSAVIEYARPASASEAPPRATR